MTWRTLLFAVFSLSAASTAAPQQPLRVAGTGSAVAAMARLEAEAQARDPSIRIHVLPSLGSTGAIRAVADGAIDLAVSGRPLREAERALGVVSREVARTPFLFAVGPRVGATSLTTDDLVAIYRGSSSPGPTASASGSCSARRPTRTRDILGSISPGVAAAVDAAARGPGCSSP